MNTFGLQHLTPVLVVDEVEPCLRFWTEKLGFAAENQVPGDNGKLVFASAKAGDVEVMYQTRASVLAERPDAAAECVGHSTVLFITVDDLGPGRQAASRYVLRKHRTLCAGARRKRGRLRSIQETVAFRRRRIRALVTSQTLDAS